MKRAYPAIIDKDENSDYGISFPDFPGCVSAGDTPEEAIAMGAEALAGHVALMVKDGDALPEPSLVENIVLDDDLPVPVALVLIPVFIGEQARRINISLDERLIEEIDAVSKNRSGFLASAAREKLARLQG
ncbi:HicB family protein [Alphaproteobacteria bacterium]|nr:HicB family protein [Alphaproteobacteria bacterium]